MYCPQYDVPYAYEEELVEVIIMIIMTAGGDGWILVSCHSELASAERRKTSDDYFCDDRLTMILSLLKIDRLMD